MELERFTPGEKITYGDINDVDKLDLLGLLEEIRKEEAYTLEHKSDLKYELPKDGIIRVNL